MIDLTVFPCLHIAAEGAMVNIGHSIQLSLNIAVSNMYTSNFTSNIDMKRIFMTIVL